MESQTPGAHVRWVEGARDMKGAGDDGDDGLGELDVGDEFGNTILEERLHLRSWLGGGVDAALGVSEKKDFVDWMIKTPEDQDDDSGCSQHALKF